MKLRTYTRTALRLFAINIYADSHATATFRKPKAFHYFALSRHRYLLSCPKKSLIGACHNPEISGSI
jgi:hypothetical protein